MAVDLRRGPLPVTESSLPESIDGFISYSRRDTAAALPLVDWARGRGRTFWLDTRDIVPGAQWNEELTRAIESANAVICLISPTWLASPECRAELARAVEYGKRLVAVALMPLDPRSVPRELSAIQWIEIRGRSAGEVADTILAAIDYDAERVAEHTHWLASARRWQERGQNRSLLVRGRDLRSAEEWLGRSGVDPRPVPLQIEFVRASRRGERQRLRRLLIAAATAVVISVSLAVVAFVQRGIAVRESNTATSRALAASSQAQLSTDPELSLLLARAAWRSAPTTQATTALRMSLEQSLVRRTIRTGSSELDDVAAVDGGRFLLSADASGALSSWNASTGVVSGHLDAGAQVTDLESDGQGLTGFALTTANFLLEWKVDRSTGALSALSRTGQVQAAAISADGSTIVVARTDRTVATAAAGAAFTTVGSPLVQLPLAVAVSADGTVIAVGTGVTAPTAAAGGGGGALMVSRSRGTFQTIRTDSQSALYRVMVDGAATTVFSSSAFGAGEVQRLSSGAVIAAVTDVFQAAMTSTGRYVSMTSIDGRIDLLDLAQSPVSTFELSGPTQVSSGLRFSTDGTLLTATGTNGITQVWSTADRTVRGQLRTTAGAVTDAVVLPDDRSVVTTHEDGSLRVWQLDGLVRIPIGLAAKGTSDPIDSAVYSSDGTTVLTAQSTGLVRLWRADNGVETCRYRIASPPDFCPLTSRIGLALGLAGFIPLAVLTPDGSHVVVLADDGGVWVFPMSGSDAPVKQGAGTPLSPAEVLDTPPGTLDVSPDGRLVVAGRGSAAPRLVDTRTGQLVATLDVNKSKGYFARFTPDGKSVLVMDWGGHVDLYGLDGSRMRSVASLPNPGLAIAISRNGTRIAIAVGNDISVLNVADGHSVAVLTGHVGLVDDVALSPDGQFVLSGSEDGTVGVWDVEATSEISSVAATNGPVDTVAFDGSGQKIVAGAAAGGAVLLDCSVCTSSADLARIAAEPNRSTRALTAAERKRFGVSSHLVE